MSIFFLSFLTVHGCYFLLYMSMWYSPGHRWGLLIRYTFPPSSPLPLSPFTPPPPPLLPLPTFGIPHPCSACSLHCFDRLCSFHSPTDHMLTARDFPFFNEVFRFRLIPEKYLMRKRSGIFHKKHQPYSNTRESARNENTLVSGG